MIRLLFNLNQGMFGASAPTAEPLPSTSEASLLVADFNQDMRQDLVVSNHGIAGTAGAHAGALSILAGLQATQDTPMRRTQTGAAPIGQCWVCTT